MKSNSKSSRCSRQKGSASVEYLLITVAVVFCLAFAVKGAKQYCLNKSDTDIRDCTSLDGLVVEAFQTSVEDITFLINSPF